MGILPELAVLTASAAAVAAVGPSRIRSWSTGALAAAVVLLWGAVFVLARGLLVEDTSLRYVVEQTRPTTAWTRRLSGLWSGAEGSLLLYVAIVAAVLLVGHRPAPAWQRSGVAVMVAGLSGAVAWGADPFERVALPPVGGVGMAPILEHGAMLVHPPMLYVGTALALAPGLVRDTDAARRLTLVSLALLAAALGLGASWAYVELGWGGWWAWDPIENVGLVVWLLLAGAVHADVVDRARRAGGQEGTGSFGPGLWHALCWPAVLAGAALTRTSLRTSVHAFADAAGLSVWLWPLVALAAVGAALRVREVSTPVRLEPAFPPTPHARLARAMPLVLLGVSAATIALGTWRPFVGGDGTEGWFYTRSLYAVAVVGAVGIGFAPRLSAAAHARRPTRGTLLLASGGAMVGAFVAIGLGAGIWYQVVLASSLAAGGVLVLVDARDAIARGFAHAGVLLVLVGALGGTAGSDASVSLDRGGRTDVAGLSVQLVTTEFREGPPQTVVARVLVDGAELAPSVARHPDRNLRLPEIATHSRPWRDVQAILRSAGDDGAADLTIRVRPLTQLVWWGVSLLVVSGLASARGARGSRRTG